MKTLLNTILFLILFFNISYASHETIKIAVADDFVPYTFIDQNNQVKGILIDYWNLWAEKTNNKVEFVSSSWDGTLEALQNKTVHVHSGLFKNKERTKYLTYLNPIYNTKSNIYINKKNHKLISSVNDLEGKTIGIIKDSYYESYLKKKYPKIKIKTYVRYKALNNAINNHEVDSFIDDNLVIWMNTIRYFNYNKVTKISDFELNRSLFAAVIKDDEYLKDFIITGMKLITDNDIQEIEERWIINQDLRSFTKTKPDNLLTKEEREFLSDNKIQLAIVNNWNNLSFININGNLVGLHIDLLKQINQNLNTNISISIFNNWTKAYESTQNGLSDGIFGLSWSKEREKFFYYSTAYHYIPHNIVVRSNSKNINKVKDFSNKTVITMKHGITNSIIKRLSPNTKIIYAKNKKTILEALHNKKADASLIQDINNNELIKYNLKIVKTIFTKEGELSIGIPKNKAILYSIINKGMNSITKKQINNMKNRWKNTQEEKSIFTQEELIYIEENPTIKVGVHDWGQVIFLKDGKKEINGIVGDILKRIEGISGLKFKPYTDQWSNILKKLKTKEIDLIPTAYYTKERTKYGLFSDSFLTIKEFIYVKQSNQDIRSLADLKNKRVAILKGYATIKLIKQIVPDIEIIETANLESSITKLLNEEVDAIFDSIIAIETKLREMLVTNLKAVAQNKIKANGIRLFSKKDDLLLQSILQKSLYSIPLQDKNRIISKWLNPVNIKKKINIALKIGREPFVLNRASLNGIEYDLLELIFKKNHITINSSKTMSLKELHTAFHDNKDLDIVVNVKEKKDNLFYSNTFITFENVAISQKKDKLIINSIKDLKNKKVIAFEGAAKYLPQEYKNIFNKQNRPSTYTEEVFQEKQVQDFLDKKTDVIIMDKNIFKWFLKKLSANTINNYNFDHIFPPNNTFKVAFKDENLRDIFNHNLALIKKSGEYKEIIDEYLEFDILAKLKINTFMSTILAKYILDKNIKEINEIIKTFSSLNYINKIEVFSDKLLAFSNNHNYGKFTQQNSYYQDFNIPKKVGFIRVYFNEKKLLEASNTLKLIPNLNIFENLKSYSYIKNIYQNFNYINTSIKFTKKEKYFIRNNPVIKFSEINWQPLSIIHNGKFSGLFSDYIKIIEKETGLVFKYIKYDSWIEVLKQFKNKNLDFIPSVENISKYNKLGLLSEEYSNFRLAIVTNKEGAFISSIKDLKSKTLAIPKNFTSYNLVKKNYPKMKIIGTKNIKEALSLVANGDAYAFIGHEAVAVFNILNFFQDLKIAGVSELKFHHHFLIQKTQPELVSIINKVMSHLTFEEKRAIRDKWIKNKINTAVDYTIIYEIISVFLFILIIAFFFMQKLSRAKKQIEDSNGKLQITIEDLKLTQNKLIESEKMASLGGLVAGVAHEINTPIGIGLTGITHFQQITDTINIKYDKDEMTQEEFEDYLSTSKELSSLIFKNLEKAASLVKSFKQVAVDQSSEEKRIFNLKQYMSEILKSIYAVTKKTNIKIEIDCPDNIKINSFPGAYSQIITNLIMNSIIHGFKEKEAGIISINIDQEDNQIKLIYQDNGKGIKKENLSKIFDPFYTTNRDFGGSGLGLNIIYNIITSTLNGSIQCESEENKGVKFIIILHL